MKHPILYLFIVAVLYSCGTTNSIKRQLRSEQSNNSFFRGMVLYDPIKKKQRINVNGKKYFTPASNTKILTFYAAYKSLQDTLRTFVYRETADSLILRGTGDPGFLYGFNDSLALAFLQSKKQGIYLEDSKLAEPVFGDGWSWEDYPYYYMPEKSLFAMYGNVMKMEVKGDSVDF
ncbi:MAG: D-alanyl-D-alanine carboxypeptidase, partial [Flavobacteriaceae bacterium]|nr:D-alanyl-D-alanine carboxypeptidase [Flavobacteriaceae bacterium]